MPEEALPPAVRVLQMVTAPWISQAIYVAAKLGVADHLHAGPKSAAELAEATGTHADALARVLRALVGVGIFFRDADGRFGLTEMGETLRRDVPNTAAGFAVFFGEPFHWRTVGGMLDTVRTGETAFHREFGGPFFDYLAGDHGAASIFDHAMTSISAPEGPAIARAYDFGRFARVVDVAGGRGHLLGAILKAHPALRGVLFDTHYSVRAGRELLAAEGVADRVEFVEGDFFEGVPSGGDAYFLKHILHDWSDEKCRAILANCAKAMRPGATLLIAEFVLPEGGAPFFGKFLDLEMLLFTDGGRERTAAEYRALLEAAGFEMRRVVPTETDMSLVEARRR